MHNLKEIQSSLAELGFTELESRVYLYVYSNGPLSARDISLGLKTLAPAVYRSANRLVDKGVLSRIGERPQIFQVLGGVASLKLMIERERSRKLGLLNSLEKAMVGIDRVGTTQTLVELISGKEKIYKKSAKLIRKAVKEIFIVSIGESLPTYLMKADKDAVDRGVDVRFIAHKHDSSNESALLALKVNGIKVRHYPDWGFHLVLIDSSAMFLGVNNPQNKKERVSMFIRNTALTDAVRDYFLKTWQLAHEV